MNDPSKASVFRPDIEGLRAVAVLSVLLFHAGLPVTGGYVGVDVFFVISGFLITGLLLREVEKSGSVSLVGFYARRAKRLLPAASVVLIASIPLTWQLAPRTEHSVFAMDAVAAAAYFVNWRFADRAVDYLAEDVGRSPVLHFWSLSVEEQFYFIWPLLIIFAVALARKLGRRVRPTTALALAMVLVPSLTWSIIHTGDNQARAFFVTTTRLWELSVGALTALGLPLLTRLPKRSGPAFVWLGVVLVVLACALFDDKSPWPGYWALVPTLGTALVIVGGSFEQRGYLLRALSSRPMVWVGGLSYSVYLWHWPLVVVGQDWLDLEGYLWGTALVTASFVPAWLSYRFVERPFRFSQTLSQSPFVTLSLGANLSMLAVVAGLLLFGLDAPLPSQNQATETVRLTIEGGRVVAEPSSLGAGALGTTPSRSKAGNPKNSYKTITPEPLQATKDVPRAYLEGCQAAVPDTEPKWCEIGDPNGKRRAVVLGDSKILQYYEAIDAIGKAGRWKISTATKSSCPSMDAMKLTKGAPYETCYEFNKNVMDQLEREPPQVAITSQGGLSAFIPGESDVPTQEGMVSGLVSRWSKMQKLGIQVVVVLDNPDPDTNVYKCLAENADRARVCAFSRAEAIPSSASEVQRKAARQVPGVRLVDVNDYICPRSRCAPVIGDVLVYRQGSHITNTYARSLAPILGPLLLAAMSEQPE